MTTLSLTAAGLGILVGVIATALLLGVIAAVALAAVAGPLMLAGSFAAGGRPLGVEDLMRSVTLKSDD